MKYTNQLSILAGRVLTIKPQSTPLDISHKTTTTSKPTSLIQEIAQI